MKKCDDNHLMNVFIELARYLTNDVSYITYLYSFYFYLNNIEWLS